MPSYARRHQLQGSLTYHVYNRSNQRVDIFNEVDDFTCFIDILRRYKKRYKFLLYHWVIMNNHFHLLIEIEHPEEISKVMAGVGKSYSNYYHKKNKTVGYLWQGRFKLQPIEKEGYLLACGRYIERNPVQAGIVKKAEEYRFSSARCYCRNAFDDLLDTNPFYYELGNDAESRMRSYGRFLSSCDKENFKRFDQVQNPVGNLKFLEKLIKLNGRYMPRRKGRARNRNCFLN